MNQDPRDSAITHQQLGLIILAVPCRCGRPASSVRVAGVLKGSWRSRPVGGSTWLTVDPAASGPRAGPALGPACSSATHEFTATPGLGHSCRPHAADLPGRRPRRKPHRLKKEAVSKWPHSAGPRSGSKSLLSLPFALSFKAPPVALLRPRWLVPTTPTGAAHGDSGLTSVRVTRPARPLLHQLRQEPCLLSAEGGRAGADLRGRGGPHSRLPRCCCLDLEEEKACPFPAQPDSSASRGPGSISSFPICITRRSPRGVLTAARPRRCASPWPRASACR